MASSTARRSPLLCPQTVEHVRKAVVFFMFLYTGVQNMAFSYAFVDTPPGKVPRALWSARRVMTLTNAGLWAVALGLMFAEWWRSGGNGAKGDGGVGGRSRDVLGWVSRQLAFDWAAVLFAMGNGFGAVSVSLMMTTCNLLRATPVLREAMHNAADGEHVEVFGEVLTPSMATRCIGGPSDSVSSIMVATLGTAYFSPIMLLLVFYNSPPWRFAAAVLVSTVPILISLSMGLVLGAESESSTYAVFGTLSVALLIAMLCAYVIAKGVRNAHLVETLTREKGLALELAKQRQVSAIIAGQLAHDVSQAVHCALDAVDDAVLEHSLVERVHASLRLATNLLADSMDMAALTEGRLQLNQAPGDLRTVLRQVQAVAKGIGDVVVELQVEKAESPHWQALEFDAVRVSQILLNALSNATKVAPPDSKVTVLASLFPSLPALKSSLQTTHRVSSSSSHSHHPSSRPHHSYHSHHPFSHSHTPPLFDVDATSHPPAHPPPAARTPISPLSSAVIVPVERREKERGGGGEGGCGSGGVGGTGIGGEIGSVGGGGIGVVMDGGLVRGLQYSASLEEYPRECVWVLVRVLDEGLGLQGEDPARLFESFEQATKAVSDLLDEATRSGMTDRPMERIRGRGLGLSMVKRLVTHMGGAVALRDRRDRESGCEFSLAMPIIRCAKTSHRISTRQRGCSDGVLRGKRVFVCDDTPLMRRTLVSGVKRLGAEKVQAVGTGEELVAHPLVHSASVILCDMDLGAGWSGQETVRQLRRASILCPIVLVSGNALSDQEVKDAGATAHLTKPFSSDILQYTLSSIFQRQEQMRAEGGGGDAPITEESKPDKRGEESDEEHS